MVVLSRTRNAVVEEIRHVSSNLTASAKSQGQQPGYQTNQKVGLSFSLSAPLLLGPIANFLLLQKLWPDLKRIYFFPKFWLLKFNFLLIAKTQICQQVSPDKVSFLFWFKKKLQICNSFLSFHVCF